jgi:hypothetical protein
MDQTVGVSAFGALLPALSGQALGQFARSVAGSASNYELRTLVYRLVTDEIKRRKSGAPQGAARVGDVRWPALSRFLAPLATSDLQALSTYCEEITLTAEPDLAGELRRLGTWIACEVEDRVTKDGAERR